jgi:hypothetical protein
MKTVLQIFKHNERLCLDVTAFAQELGWQEGDAVEAIKSTRGIELISTRSLNAQAMGTAKDFMEKYPAAMKRLAE